MPTNKQLDKEDVVHIDNGEYCSAIKNYTLPFVTIWTDLEGIMLSEISQTEKDKYYRISLACRM